MPSATYTVNRRSNGYECGDELVRRDVLVFLDTFRLPPVRTVVVGRCRARQADYRRLLVRVQCRRQVISAVSPWHRVVSTHCRFPVRKPHLSGYYYNRYGEKKGRKYGNSRRVVWSNVKNYAVAAERLGADVFGFEQSARGFPVLNSVTNRTDCLRCMFVVVTGEWGGYEILIVQCVELDDVLFIK